MLSNYKAIAITHKEIPLSQLANYIVPGEEAGIVKEKLYALKQEFGIDELMYVATCNRVFYFFTKDQPLTAAFVNDFFLRATGADRLSTDASPAPSTVARLLEGENAVEYLFKVVASIDSLVVGEREILRQVREAYDRCNSWGLTGDDIRIAMKKGVETAKSVFTETRIGEKPVSVVSLAGNKLRAYKLPKNAKVVMIGAGQTNRLFAKFLSKYKFSNVHIFNRTLEKAQELAATIDARAYPLEGLPEAGKDFDCLIVCTGSNQPILTQDLYRQLICDQQPRIVIDLAVPHNVSDVVVENFPVQYTNVEALRLEANTNRAFREKEVERSLALIREKLKEFHNTYKRRQMERALHTVPNQIKSVKEKALQQVFRQKLDNVDDHSRQLIAEMMAYMEKKCIGISMKAAKSAIT